MAQQRGAPDRLAVGDSIRCSPRSFTSLRRQPGFVPRPRLVEASTRGLARTLTWSPPRLASGRQRCWPTGATTANACLPGCRSTRATSTRCAYATIAALDRVRPGLATRLARCSVRRHRRPFEGLVTTLVNELVARPDDDPALLVLDDYHLVESQAVHESLTFLLEHPPPRMHLILSTREDPPLARAAARPQGADGAAGR